MNANTELLSAKSVSKHVRVSPQKARRVINVVRGLQTSEALSILRLLPHSPARHIYKTVAAARAGVLDKASTGNLAVREDQLFVREAKIDEGVTLKRIRSRARGRMNRINKRTSHISIVVSAPVAGAKRSTKVQQKSATGSEK